MPEREKPIRQAAYSPAQRLDVLRVALEARAMGYRECAELLEVSVKTVTRLVHALTATCAVDEEKVDGRVLFRIRSAKPGAVRFTLMEIVAIGLLRCLAKNLEGTGIEGDIDSAWDKLKATLQKQDVALMRGLERKLFFRPYGRRRYAEREDHMSDVMTALLHGQQLEVTHVSEKSGETTFLFDPYTLVLYKTGLYLAGKSHRHDKVVLLALDSIREVTWKKGVRVACPEAYTPASLDQGGFGLHGGASLEVRLAFDARVARNVMRTEWHPTQREDTLPDGRTLLTMTVNGATELTSWILSWGAACEVLGPDSLRKAVKQELSAMAARY